MPQNVQLPDGSTLADVPDGTTQTQLIEKLRANNNPNWQTMASSLTSKYSPTSFLTHKILMPLQSIEDFPMKKLAQGADYVGQKAADATGSPAVGAGVNTAIQAVPMFIGGAETESAKAMQGAAAASAAAATRAMQYVEGVTGIPWAKLSASARAMMTSIAKDAQDLAKLDPKATERVLRAQSLDAPVPMTAGQANRDLSQITREESIRKSDAGQPLRDTMSAQDEALHRNLDILKQDAGKGSKVATRADVGKSVQGVARRKLDVLEQQKNTLYDKAKAAGETAEPVDLTALKDWLKQPVNERNAGFLKSAIADYEKGGRVSINDLEEIRKEAVANAMGPRSTTTHYAGEAVGIIDGILDKAGSGLYKQARAANRAIKEEFDRQGAIRQLSGEKGRTTDRTVALEDTIDHVLVRGSNEDLQKVKETLTSGPTKAQGERAWRDLQAGVIDYLKEKAGGKRRILNEEAQGQFNSTFLDALYDLDRDGKLNTLFGESIANRIRTLAKTVHDVRTTPAGRISGSDSVPRILNTLESAMKITDVPVLGPMIRGAGKLYKMGAAGRDAEKALKTPLAEAAARKGPRPPPQSAGIAELGSAQLGMQNDGP